MESSQTVDLADEAAVNAAFGEATEAIGGLDILVNNVGESSGRASSEFRPGATAPTKTSPTRSGTSRAGAQATSREHTSKCPAAISSSESDRSASPCPRTTANEFTSIRLGARRRERSLRQPSEQIAKRVLVDLVAHLVFAPRRFDADRLQLLKRFAAGVDRNHRILGAVDD